MAGEIICTLGEVRKLWRY